MARSLLAKEQGSNLFSDSPEGVSELLRGCALAKVERVEEGVER